MKFDGFDAGSRRSELLGDSDKLDSYWRTENAVARTVKLAGRE